LVRKVLSYAQLRGVITALPRLPKVKREDEPRGLAFPRISRHL